MKSQIIFILLVTSAVWAGETARVHLWPVKGSVASGVHVMFMGRKAMEERMKLPGAADLTAYVLEQAYRGMEDDFDELGCELQFTDFPFIPFDDYYTRDDMAFIRLRVPAGSEAESITLLGTLMESARKADPDMIGRAIKGCTMANRMRRSTGQFAGLEFRNWMFPGSDLTMPTYMKEAPADMALYKKFLTAFLAPENMLVTVAGNTTGDDLQAALNTARISGNVTVPDLHRLPAMNRSEPVLNVTAPGGQGYLLLMSPLPAMKTDRDRAAAVLWASRISNRIAFQLREKEGLAYSIGAGISEIGGNQFLTIHMGTGPETVASAGKRIPEMIDALRKEPVGDDELIRLKNSVLIKRRMRRLMNINKAFFVGLDILYGIEPGSEDRIDTALPDVTTADMQQAMNTLGTAFLTLQVNAGEKPAPEKKSMPMGMGKMPPGMGR